MEMYYPITHPQKRILDSELIDQSTDKYLILLKYTFENADAAALYTAAKNLIEKCRDLNLRFKIAGDGVTILQYEGEPDISLLKEIDFSGKSSEMQKWLDEYIARPFDPLWDVPLYQFTVLRGDERSIVHVKIHHAITDGTGSVKLGELLNTSYQAALQNSSIAMTGTYLTYVNLEKQYMESSDFKKDRDFWINNLSDTAAFPESLAKESFKSAYLNVALNQDLTNKLNKCCDSLPGRVTPFKFCLALLGIYLARRYASDSVPILTAYSNRKGLPAEMENTIGMLVSTLVVKLDYDPQIPFSQYITNSADVLKQALIHGRFPLDLLTEELVKQGEKSGKLFNFSVVSNSKVSTEYGFEFQLLQNSAFPLVFRINPALEDEFGLQKISIEYLKDVFDFEEVQFMAEGILAMIKDVAENPDKPVSQLEILGVREKNILLNDLKGKTLEYEKEKTFIDNFRAAARLKPEATAVVDFESSMDYGTLDSLSDSIAAELERDYSATGRFAAIMLPRRKEFITAVLAVMKAGGAYVPVDSGYPQDRIEYMLQDSNAAVLITTREFERGTGGFAGKVLFIEDSFLDKGLKPMYTPIGDDLAYMIYTSGSTGRPKGVMIRHKSLAAMNAWKIHDYEISNNTKTCVHSSFSFDASVIDIFPVLNAGGTLHIISEGMRFDMAGFYQYIKENKIDDCTIPTQLGMEILRAYDLPIKRIMLGGEKLKKLPQRNVILMNGYGPTEFTVASSYFVVDQNKDYANIPIGKPVPNTWNYVVDKELKLVAFGCAGELCLSGDQIAKGYWNRDDLTEKAFVKNPYACCEENKLMYRTGDLVRWNQNGDLEYLGRIDDQVKLRGFRVELGEVESAMTAFDGITGAVVLVQKDMLAAYYVCDREIDENALAAYLSIRLPEYMVPVAYLRIDKMPLTPGGKVNKKALPTIELAAQEIVAPQSEMQKEIFDIVSGVIGNTSFGITTDLFYAGMSSLSAIKITAFLCKKYNVSMSAQSVIRGKTIAAMEALIMQADGAQSNHFEKMESYPLTQSQLGVYFDCAKQPGTLQYNVPSALTFTTDIDAQKLALAFKEVINAHPYIKTHFAMRGQELRQIRCDTLSFEVPVFETTEPELEQAKSTFAAPFNLFEGPLFRAAVYKTSKSVTLLSDFHHIVFDGGSMDILLNDLARVYNGDEIAEEGYTSFDWAVEEKESEKSEAYRKAERYFYEKLKDCEGATMITGDIVSSKKQGDLDEQTSFVEKMPVKDFCTSNGITPSNLFLSGVAYVISRFVGNKTVLISTISNGRAEAKHQRNFGMMVKTLPAMINIVNQKSIDFVQATQQSMFETMSHDCYPFTCISETYHFTPQIMYAFQSGVLSGCCLCGQQARFESLALKTPKFKLSVHVEEDHKSFKICAQYDNAIYSKELMETFAECVALAIDNIVKNPEQMIGKISIVPLRQMERIESFNKTTIENEIRVLHKMFEKQAEIHANNIALIASDGTFTYAQLNEKANRIANALIENGLQAEDRVAFLLSRDSRLIATMLGIIKAGGAYIPIDPEYPPDRIHYILRDSSTKYIISTRENTGNLPRGQMLEIDGLLQHENRSNPNVEVRPESLCYIIYTSGSTGKPKGVMLEHKGISNYVAPTKANRHVLALVQNAHSMLSVTTVSFDMFLKESFTVLMNGLTLVFADEEQANNPVRLAELFERTSADAFNTTPSRMLQYIELPALKNALSKCNVIMAGGEKYPAVLYDRLREISDAKLFNTYGPTEITVSSNAKELTDNNISVGPPLSNVKEYIMDIDGNRLPVGVVGELWIGGEGVARGYWGNLKLTGESFIYSDGDRIYKTGDLAKWTNDGDVVILGRTDGQVKLRGLRIELGEIQSAVCKYPGIRSAVVAIKKVQGHEHICAYYTAQNEVVHEKLRESLKESLAKYMVPTAYMRLEKIPVTPNGKADIRALPEPMLMARQEYVSPVNETESCFCEIFSKVLGISQVGATDGFFDIGGTSLLVTKVTIEALNKGYNVSYGDVFTHSTPRDLALLLNSQGGQKEEDIISEYDYDEINQLLKKNTMEACLNGETQEIGNILLSGATGFLGIHVLKEFLEHEKGIAYCFMRKGRQTSLEKRLKSMLVYYFDNSYDELFGTRIFAVEGDITNKFDFDRLLDLPINTMINCAANVKHYALGSEIETINVDGVKNAVEFCMKKECMLIQISTTSVAGISIDGNPPEDTVLDEKMLYAGQDLENKYIGSKFRGERIVLEAITKGLNGKIMRVGNLMARSLDGEFQINFHTNGFVNRLRAYHAIGKIAFPTLSVATEFAPIDSTAQSILKLARTPKECCVFHPYNNHYIFIGDIIEVMNERGMGIQAVEEREFQKAFSLAMRDKTKEASLAGLIAYLNMGRGKRVYMLHTSNEYTIQVLHRFGFKWPLTTDGYLDKFISLLDGLGFFQEEKHNV